MTTPDYRSLPVSTEAVNLHEVPIIQYTHAPLDIPGLKAGPVGGKGHQQLKPPFEHEEQTYIMIQWLWEEMACVWPGRALGP